MFVFFSSDILMFVFFSRDVLMNVRDGSDILMNVFFGRDVLMNIRYGSDILMNIFLSSDILMNVGNGSGVNLSSVVIRVYNDGGGMDNRGGGSSGVVSISQGGTSITSISRESCISSIASIGGDDSGGSHRQKSRNSDKSLGAAWTT